MLAIHALRRVGEAGVAAGAIARQAGAVIPAARVLGRVAADRPGVADLRARDLAGRVREQPVLRADHWIALDLGERGQRADLDAVGGFADALELGDAAEIDHRLWALDAFLEPRQAVVAPGHLPAILAVAVEQCERVLELSRLVQLEAGHDVLDHHGDAPSNRVDLERLVRLRPLREEVEDHVDRHRGAVEQVAAERVRDRRGDRQRLPSLAPARRRPSRRPGSAGRPCRPRPNRPRRERRDRSAASTDRAECWSAGRACDRKRGARASPSRCP